MNIDKKALKGVLVCLHAEADARDKHSAQIRDIVKAAKGKGFDGKALRKVFVRQRMDAEARQRDDDLIEAYEHALGAKGRAMLAVEEGASLEDAAEANGVHRATVARARAVAKQGSNATVANQPSDATPHDPETGEVHGEDDGSQRRPVNAVVDGPVPDERRPAVIPADDDHGADANGAGGAADRDAAEPTAGPASEESPREEGAAAPLIAEVDPWIAANAARDRRDQLMREKGLA